MANPYRGGTPDRWYDGKHGDLWVEYKFLKILPKKILPKLSALQLKWINRAYNNGRNVVVILGTPTGGYIYINGTWEFAMQREVLQNLLISKKEIAQWITERVNEPKASRTNSRNINRNK